MRARARRGTLGARRRVGPPGRLRRAAHARSSSTGNPPTRRLRASVPHRAIRIRVSRRCESSGMGLWRSRSRRGSWRVRLERYESRLERFDARLVRYESRFVSLRAWPLRGESRLVGPRRVLSATSPGSNAASLISGGGGEYSSATIRGLNASTRVLFVTNLGSSASRRAPWAAIAVRTLLVPSCPLRIPVRTLLLSSRTLRVAVRELRSSSCSPRLAVHKLTTRFARLRVAVRGLRSSSCSLRVAVRELRTSACSL